MSLVSAETHQRIQAMKQGEARRKENRKVYKKMLEKEDGGLYADKKEAK